MDLKPGETARVNVHTDRRNFRLAVAVSPGRRVRTAAGVFDCLLFNPSAGSPLGTVLLSKDKDRLPVVIRARLSGIAVTAYLRRVGKETR
jgi:hypothetical protein